MAVSFPIFGSLLISPAFAAEPVPLFGDMDVIAAVWMAAWAMSFILVVLSAIFGASAHMRLGSLDVDLESYWFQMGRVNTMFNSAQVIQSETSRYRTYETFVNQPMCFVVFAVKVNLSISIFGPTGSPEPTSRSTQDLREQPRYNSSGLNFRVLPHAFHDRTSNAIMDSAHFTTLSGQMRWRM